MRTKVSTAYLCRMFNTNNVSVREIFSGTLSSETLNELELKAESLGKLAEMSNEQILEIPGIGKKTLDMMKETLNAFFKSYVTRDIASGISPNQKPIEERVGYGELIIDADLREISIKKINKAIERLSKKDRKFIQMAYGLDGKKRKNTAQLALKFKINSMDVDAKKMQIIAKIANYID